ncbi:MAG: ATP-binding protein [Candidatus Omnitrophota bacterium]
MEKHIIKQVLLEQREEIGQVFKRRIIGREVMPEAKRIFGTDLIKAVMGIRRCGKSTLSHQLLKNQNYGYINFDDERLIGVTSKDLNDFLEILEEINQGLKHILLDEIQNVEGWELFVNRLKRTGYNIVVTGSNSKLLSKELATHLTGRHLSVELFPFSFKEFLAFKNITMRREDLFITKQKAKLKRELEEYLEAGGMPELFKVEVKKHYLRELFDKIISQDIIFRHNVKYVKDLREISLYAVSNFSSPFTYRRIKDAFGIRSVHTVKNYLDYMEEAYLVFQLNPFSFKVKQQINQPRKLYCIDTGFINALAPKTTLDRGKLMENAVFIELLRRGKEVYFYAQPDCEVDFLVKQGLRIKQLIQVCFSVSDRDTKKREIRALLRASHRLTCNDLTVITWDDEAQEVVNSKRIKFIPLWKWLLFK